MTAGVSPGVRESRFRVARTRGVLSGVLLIILGAWAGIVPFIGPYLDLAYTPQPNNAWHWTAARGWLDVLPGAVVFLGGLLLLLSASRLVTSLGGWLAAAGGAWLIVGPSLATVLSLDLGIPDPTQGSGMRALTALLFFYAVGAAILFLAAFALGRLSVQSLGDVRAAERRVAEAAAAERATEADRRNSAGAPGTAPGTAAPMAPMARHEAGPDGAAAPPAQHTAAMPVQNGYQQPEHPYEHAPSAPPPPEERR